MKRYDIHCYLLTLLLVFPVVGCRYNRQVQGPAAEDSGTALAETDTERPFSAGYYYLESRIHIKNKAWDQAVESLKKAIAKDPDSYILTHDLISLYMRMKNETGALALAERFARLNPDNVDGLLLLIQLKKETIRENELVALLNRILAIAPDNREAYLRLGKIHMENENYTEALALFTKMVEHFPDYYVGQFYLGDAHLKLKHYKDAKARFLKSIELEPDLVAPRFHLIDIYNTRKEKNHPQKVIETYEQILTIEPDNYAALFGMALAYYKSGRTKQAGEIFTELGREVDSNVRLIMSAADEYITDKRYEDAIIIFSQLLKVNPGNSTLNFFLGMAFQAAEKYEDAVKYYLKVKPGHAQYKKTVLSIALLYNRMNQVQTAINYLESRQKLFPKDIDFISYLSSFYETLEQYPKAVILLEKGLVQTPDNTTLLFRLGAIQDKTGQKDACIRTMKKIITIDPGDASALNYLGYTYADQGIRLDEALDLILRAHAIKPDDGYITDSLGWVYFRMGKFEKAREYLEKAARLTSFETVISDHLGDAYIKLNQYQNALDTYQKAVANARKEDEKLVRKIQKKILEIKKQLND